MIPRIRMVQIKNYKSLRSVSVQLEPFTVFVGPNASGKSNFIDALGFVQECLTTSLELAVNNRGGMQVILSRLEHPTPVQIPPPDLTEKEKLERLERSVEAASAIGFRLDLDLGKGQRADYSVSIALSPWRGFVVARERCVVVSDQGEKKQFEVRAGKFVHEIKGIAPVPLPDRLALYAASATEAFRPVYDFLCSMRFYSIWPDKLREPQEPDIGIYLKRDGSNAAAVLRNFYRYGPAQTDFRDRLIGLMAQVCQGLEWVQPDSAGTKEIVWFRQDIGLQNLAEFESISMSDGTLRALGLLLAVYQASQPRVVGIEEPEATIHPALTEMIMEVLIDASNERQILITTHSPDILDQKELKDNQIRVVTWRNGRTLVAPASEDDRKSIRDRLSTPGELLRIDELDPDLKEAERSAAQVDLFGEPFAGEDLA